MVFIIAEAGVNHEGSIERAIALVHAAKEAGADAVKFQCYTAVKLYSIGDSRLPRASQFELGVSDFLEIYNECGKVGIEFMSTAFDEDWAQWLSNKVTTWKVASGDFKMLKYISSHVKDKPIIFSTGCGYPKDLQDNVVLMHCVTRYPASDPQLERISDLPIGNRGYSCHHPGYNACIAAAGYGVNYIEKHFTLDNNQSEFRDHKHSLNPLDFRKMVVACKTITEDLHPWIYHCRLDGQRPKK